jgi:hypothetical protein
MGAGMSMKIFVPWLVGAVAIYAAFGLVWLVVAVLLSAPIYYVSLLLHPNRNCWACRGKGQHGGFLFDYGRRNCASCGGTGTKPRWGRRVFFNTGT